MITIYYYLLLYKKYRCVVKMAPRELGNTKSVIGRGPDNNNNNNNNNPRRIRGVRKEENQQ